MDAVCDGRAGGRLERAGDENAEVSYDPTSASAMFGPCGKVSMRLRQSFRTADSSLHGDTKARATYSGQNPSRLFMLSFSARLLFELSQPDRVAA